MNTRPLTGFESSNLACLNETGKPNALLFVTETGLKKSILDATDPVRRLLRDGQFHDYSNQRQGPENKVQSSAIIHEVQRGHEVIASLYRPVTKKGDPRIWFSRFDRYAKPGDVCAIFLHDGRPHLLNLSRTPLHQIIKEQHPSPLLDFFSSLRQMAEAISDELLRKLQAIKAQGPIRAVCEGDTAVGRSVETALGIKINSSLDPDYKGIELKSGRAKLVGAETRATLFACVPDWTLSRCKSSEEILSEFGYHRDGDFKLYCEISTQRPNSQGLIFEIEESTRWLRELCVRAPEREVAIWRLEHLETRLSNKHHETFWIKAKSIRRSTEEWFELTSITHTKNPNVPQFQRLLSDGTVTMDHLIKRLATGRAHEKGPLFKIERPRLHELFLGEPRSYNL